MLVIVFMLRVFRAHFSPVKCLKPFSAIGPNPWLNIGRVSADSFQSVYSIKCVRNASDTYISSMSFQLK